MASKQSIIYFKVGKTKVKIEMPESAARMCGTISNMLDDVDDRETSIPIPNIELDIFQKVEQYCKKYKDTKLPSTEEEILKFRIKPLEGWDKEFVNVPLSVLFEMITAANFLDVKHMLDITCKSVAEMIKGKTPDDIKKIFGVEGDFSDEEREQVLADNPWLVDSEPPSDDTTGGAPAPQSTGGATAPQSTGGAPAQHSTGGVPAP